MFLIVRLVFLLYLCGVIWVFVFSSVEMLYYTDLLSLDAVVVVQ